MRQWLRQASFLKLRTAMLPSFIRIICPLVPSCVAWADDFRCLAEGFFAEVSFDGFLPAMGISISFWLRAGFLDLACFFGARVRSRVLGIGPQIGCAFPLGDMQGFLVLRGHGDFDAANRSPGWSTWLTFAISPAAPTAEPKPPKRLWT